MAAMRLGVGHYGSVSGIGASSRHNTLALLSRQVAKMPSEADGRWATGADAMSAIARMASRAMQLIEAGYVKYNAHLPR